MAKKIKDYYDSKCAKLIADKISKVFPKFKSEEFTNFVAKHIKGKEMFARQDVYVQAFQLYMHNDYKKNLKVFHKILGPELTTDTGMFIYGWWLWPIGRYVEKMGTEHPSETLEFIYELTKRFTGEFAIRPVLEQNPKKTLSVIKKWSKDKNVHVRRLASEGIRISLPWAKKSKVFLNHFDECCQILTNLKDSQEKFVQKSIGNNINDLLKADLKLGNKIISDWKKSAAAPHVEWIIKHGTRTIRKKSNSIQPSTSRLSR